MLELMKKLREIANLFGHEGCEIIVGEDGISIEGSDPAPGELIRGEIPNQQAVEVTRTYYVPFQYTDADESGPRIRGQSALDDELADTLSPAIARMKDYNTRHYEAGVATLEDVEVKSPANQLFSDTKLSEKVNSLIADAVVVDGSGVKIFDFFIRVSDSQDAKKVIEGELRKLIGGITADVNWINWTKTKENLHSIILSKLQGCRGNNRSSDGYRAACDDLDELLNAFCSAKAQGAGTP